MVKTEYGRRGCWTCKARKVSCDRESPFCRTCIQTSRRCEGYEDRLSWPRPNDEKRALVASPTKASTGAKTTQFRFVNSATWQVRLHWDLSCTSTAPSPTTSPGLILPLTSPRRQSRSGLEWDELVRHFHSKAYLSLITFNTPPTAIRDVLMRIISNTYSESYKGVYLALLAFSSLHRQCYQQAAHLKLAALQALSTSSRTLALGQPMLHEAICHVAACMLLCSFDTLGPSPTSGEWLWYVLGAMGVIFGTDAKEAADSASVSVLLDWFYYHYALSRFATRHWNHKQIVALPVEDGDEDTEVQQHVPLSQQLRITWREFPPTHTILSLLAEACETLPHSSGPPSISTAEDEKKLNGLRSRTALLPFPWKPSHKAALVLSTTAEVYQAAVLIYLKQASHGPWDLSSSPQWLHANSIDALVDAIFDRHIEVSSECSHFFPLLMIACEARTEERRAAIMRCMERTDGNIEQGRNFDRIRAEIKHMWVQQDLFADVDLCEDTQRLLCAVVSSNSALPSYA